MNTFAERCEREDEEDRLAEVYARRHDADRLQSVLELLMELKDDGILAAWHLRFPDREESHA